MKIYWKSGFFFLSLSFLTSISLAGFFVGPGGTSSSFLNIPISARSAGLSHALTAGRGDVSSLDFNPAGLWKMENRQINLSLVDHLEDTSLQAISGGFPFFPTPDAEDTIYLGAHYRSFSADDEARDDLGKKLRTFEIKDQLLQLAVAYAPFSKLALGLSGKIINHEIQDTSNTNYAFDTGLLLNMGERLSVGASFLNIGPSNKFNAEKGPLPFKARLGAEVPFKPFLFLTDVSIGRDKIAQPAGGVEWSPVRFLHIRSGLLFHKTLEFSAGLGFQFSPQSAYRPVHFGLDYAARTQNELGLNHTVTVKILY